jgi:hypothetical protein
MQAAQSQSEDDESPEDHRTVVVNSKLLLSDAPLAERLLRFSDSKAHVVVIADDSFSMGTIEPSVTQTAHGNHHLSRWSKLQFHLSQLCNLLRVIDASAMTLKLLNEDSWFMVNSEDDLEKIFVHRSRQPQGLTPLFHNLNTVIERYPGNEPVTVLVFVDGSSTDAEVDKLLRSSHPSARHTFVLCTDDPEVVAAYKLFEMIDGVSVMTDYAGASLMGGEHNHYLARCLLGEGEERGDVDGNSAKGDKGGLGLGVCSCSCIIS